MSNKKDNTNKLQLNLESMVESLIYIERRNLNKRHHMSSNFYITKLQIWKQTGGEKKTRR